MFSPWAALRTLVLPFGTLTGTRIILDGVNGRISVFDGTNAEVIRVDAATSKIVVGDADGGTSSRIEILGATSKIAGYNASNFEGASFDAASGYIGVQSSTGTRSAQEIRGTQAQHTVTPSTQGALVWDTGAFLGDHDSAAPYAPFAALFSPKEHSATKQANIALHGGVVGADTSDIQLYADTVNVPFGINHDGTANGQWSLAWGTSVITTNASGDADVGAAIFAAVSYYYTAVKWALVMNGDGGARANVTMATMSTPNDNSWNVRSWAGSTGAAVASVAVRFNWIALGQ